MKSISATERTAILVCLCGVFGVVLADVFGGFVALRFFQFSVGMSCIFGAFFAVSDGISRLQHRIEIRKRKLVRLDRKNERLRVIHAESGGNFFHVDTRTGTAEAFFRPSAPRRVSFHAGSGPGPGIDAAHRPDAATILSGVACALVCGGRGAGKTELVRHIAAERARVGRVLLIDPKPEIPGKWDGCRVVGPNMDYGAIEAVLGRLTESMAENRGPMLIILDEVTRLNLRISGFSNLWLPLLLEGREYGIDVWLIGQSKTASSIGLSGKYDILECFDVIASAKRDRAGNRWIEVEDDSGAEPIVAEHPGPFHGHGHGCHGTGAAFYGYPDRHDSRDSRDSHDGRDALSVGYDPDSEPFTYAPPKPRRVFESRREKQAVDMAESGLSLNAIARKLFGGSNGRRTKIIREILAKHRTEGEQ